jgi:hypothetical protein
MTSKNPAGLQLRDPPKRERFVLKVELTMIEQRATKKKIRT